MKPLLIVVPLYPERHPLCQEWLEKESDLADIRYLHPGPVGPDIYGSGGQLYTGGAINKELFERVYPEWLKCKHQFFGMCYDDVVVTAPEKPLEKAIEILKGKAITCVGAFNRDQDGGDFKDYCSRFWVTRRDLLAPCTWLETWKRWEFPDWEGSWLRWSGLKCSLLPGLEFNHLLSYHDHLGLDAGWTIEYYRGCGVVHNER
jgi:hypothetical protein